MTQLVYGKDSHSCIAQMPSQLSGVLSAAAATVTNVQDVGRGDKLIIAALVSGRGNSRVVLFIWAKSLVTIHDGDAALLVIHIPWNVEREIVSAFIRQNCTLL